MSASTSQLRTHLAQRLATSVEEDTSDSLNLADLSTRLEKAATEQVQMGGHAALEEAPTSTTWMFSPLDW